ncbi:MAG TPA: hypothetical protein VNJ01_10005 [Bacteriovoracaceae bacterium]|nr:hypothetical protein [Bacteriovoracaceae bacterium]
MLKIVLPLIALSLVSTAEAASCKVFGISDSPQALSCKFQDSTVILRCENGRYYLNSSKVTEAYHMEVEEGPVPLIFQSREMTLAVLIESETEVRAELESLRKSIPGTCTFQ